MLRLTPHGGAGSTTGANFLLEINEKKILVDCGMEQGQGADNHNFREFPYEPEEIDTLFVTHAHIDHVGLIPKLVKEGFSGEIYSTPETKAIAELLLLDAAKIGRNESESLYGIGDVNDSLNLWKTAKYHDKKEFENFSAEFLNAGHILGSAMINFSFSSGETMLFTGDLGNSPSIILPDAEKVSGLDYLLIESVYGDRNHESKSERDEKFERVVRETIERGGTLLIPAFSLERTQVILYKLDNLFESKKVQSVPVYLDSPLAIRLTEIYERVKDQYNAVAKAEIERGDDIFKFKELRLTASVGDSQQISKVVGAKIIIAGSGMSTAGRIVSHEETYLPDPNSTILLAGFQAQGTLGRAIENGGASVVIDGKEVPLKARVEKISGFSAHADSDALVEFVSNTADTVKKVFVAMGEPKSAIFLAQRLRDELGVEAVVAEEGKKYNLEA